MFLKHVFHKVIKFYYTIYVFEYAVSSFKKFSNNPSSEAMAKLRDQIGPDQFCAPLNQGELTDTDKYKLSFLIIFPCVFFILAVTLTSVLQ